MQGRVLAGSNNTFTVECDDDVTRFCTIKGKVLKSDKQFYNPLAPGDLVEVEADPINDEKGQVLSLLPRKNTFLRWNVKGRCPQLLASNLDYLILVTTPDEPPFRPRFIDRALAQAEHQGITPVVVCNKYDLAEQMQNDGRTEEFDEIDRRLTIWGQLGYRVLRLSAKTGEGMTEFAELLENHTSAFVGQSGVGKSSLINVMDSTCVLKNDSSETNMIKIAFGEENARKLKISSTKSMHGHCLGATGAIEAMVCVKAIQDSFVPCTKNLDNVDVEGGCDLDYVPNKGIEMNIDAAMSATFGFGGHNGAIIVKKVK